MEQIITIKSWDKYSYEEKNKLLQHWWYYYGKMLVSLAEWEQFNKLVQTDIDQVFEIAVTSYIHGFSSQPLLYAMRNNTVDSLVAALPQTDKLSNEGKNIYAKAKYDFTSMLVKSLNNPEPSIPMQPEVILEQIDQLVKRR